MKNKAKIKNLFIVLVLCLVVAVPIFSRQINVKADTQVPIYELDEGFISINNVWYLLLKKENSEFLNSINNNVVVYNTNKQSMGSYQIRNIYNWSYVNEFYYLDYNSLSYQYDLPNIEHYSDKYLLIDMSLWASENIFTSINSEIIKVGIRTQSTNVLVWDKTYNSSKHNVINLVNLINYYEQLSDENYQYEQGYNKGLLDGKADAFENYDNLLPTVLGSIAMFFIGIFGSVEVFGMTLLTVFGIVGSLLLIWFVLRLVMG